MRWAEISTGVVTNMTVSESEHFGGAWLDENVGGEWVLAPDALLVGIGFSYYPDRGAFLEPQPFPSWTLNDEELLWVSPVPMPSDGFEYYWDESAGDWVRVSDEAV
jgi:hypothetical protein